MVNKGKTEIKSGSEWLPVKVGQNLGKDDEIKLAENSYLGLVHKSGKPHEIKQSGKYKVSELAAKIGDGTTSVLNKYTDFILSSTTNPKNNLNATGAVHRGVDAPLNLPAGDKGVIFNNEIIINWDTEKMTPPYIVEFKSLFEDVLYSVETKDQYVIVNLADKNFNKEDNILVTVSSKSGPKSEKYSLNKLSKNDQERIKTLIKENNININEPSALGKLFLARFYEENGLLIDAATALQKAIMQEPDVTAYKDAYSDFLYRTGIKGVQEEK
jgi:hypothetical protein